MRELIKSSKRESGLRSRLIHGILDMELDSHGSKLINMCVISQRRTRPFRGIAIRDRPSNGPRVIRIRSGSIEMDVVVSMSQSWIPFSQYCVPHIATNLLNHTASIGRPFKLFPSAWSFSLVFRFDAAAKAKPTRPSLPVLKSPLLAL